MTEYGLTSTGFVRKRLVDIKAELEAKFQTAFGYNINLSAESVFGQLIGIMAAELDTQWESQENIYNSQYPSTAQGDQLSNVVMFNGIERQAETYSTAILTLTGTPGRTVPAGSLATVSLTGYQFATDEAATIGGGGTITVGSTCTTSGAITAVAGSINTIGSPYFGWTAVTNASDAEVGLDQESDPALRERRALSTMIFGGNMSDACYSQIKNLSGVIDVKVFNNRTDTTDVNGVPPNQFMVVVLGGAEASIAQIVWDNTPQGISSFGDNPVTIIDGQGYEQIVYYSRPTEVPIYFKLEISTTSAFGGEAELKAAVAAYGTENFGIDSTVIMSQFYTPINTISGITSIGLYMGLTASPSTTSNIDTGASEIPIFDTTQGEVVYV